MKKITLNDFPDEYLDYIEELLLTMKPEQITSMIAELKEKRKKRQEQDWNSAILVEDIGLDWTTVIKLKKQNINTLYDLMKQNITKIPGLYQSEIERIDWAILFFDMTFLQQMHNDNPKATQMDVAKQIVTQGETTQKIMKLKYGHEV